MLSLVSYQRWMWNELWRWQVEHHFAWTGEGVPWPFGAEPPREMYGTRPPEPERALIVADITVDKVLRAGVVGTFAAGIALHETKAYVFLDDLTTNPDAPLRLRHAGATLVLACAKQFCLSIGKPACAFTSQRGLYKIARRLGFEPRPAGALLVFQAPHAPIDGVGAIVIPKNQSDASGQPSPKERDTAAHGPGTARRTVNGGREAPITPLRRGAVAARQAHNLEVDGAIPSAATNGSGERRQAPVVAHRAKEKSGPVAKPARSTVDGENVSRSDRHPSNGQVPRQVVKRIVKSADGKTITVVKRLRPLPNR